MAVVVHYAIGVPPDQRGPLAVKVKLQYRKFDARYMQLVHGKKFINDLPITTIATDWIVFPIEGAEKAAASAEAPAPPWQRWHDYGIGLLLEGSKASEKGGLIQATTAFLQVEKLGKADGAVNLARAYFKEGRLEDAVIALQRASRFDPPAPPWTVTWLNSPVDKQNGVLDKAIAEFRSIVGKEFAGLTPRGFDFSKDYEILNELGQSLFERAKMERGPERQAAHRKFLEEAAVAFNKTLALDPENLTAHYTLALIDADLGDQAGAEEHRKLARAVSTG